MSVTVITQPSGGVSYTDNGDTVYLEKREPARSGGNRETVDTWGGSSAAIKEYYLQLAPKSMIKSISVAQNGASSKMTVVWGVDGFDGETPQDDGIEESDSDQWSVSPIEIPTALAAHPYFQVGYSPGTGEVIETGLAEADLAISNGEPYVASGPYAQWIARYYALRMAGVEEWPQLGVQVQVQFETIDDTLLQALNSTAFQVVPVDAIGMPNGIANQVAALQKISSYTSADPSTYELAQNALEWLHRPPEIRLNKVATEIDRYTVTDTYWGIWKWSSVLYPGGSWDPIGEVAT
jgi:hypothetical protein